MSTDASALGRLMLAFDGTELPEPMRHRLAFTPAAGVTLFRYRNVESPSQVRALTDAIQACAPADEPFLIATDQEGGQLRGLGPGSTPFPGNMALGAVDDPDLTRRVGAAIGRELRAAGINVNYAPVADLATNPRNPSLGVRSFGADWHRAAVHVAAMVDGLESAGVAATLKHFPGKGDAGVDTHHELARVDRSLAELQDRELRPFMAGISAGASLVMSGHFAIPSLTGSRPATLTPAVMGALLRADLGFRGVTISDAFDMEALSPGDARLADAVDGLNGGLDLLLLGSTSDVSAFDATLRAADADGRLAAHSTAAAIGRVRALRHRLVDVEPVDLGLIGGEEHLALARAVAELALTLVRDRDGLLPVQLADDDRVLVIMPRPVDLTPADTSAAEPAGLAAAIRRHHPATEELLVGHEPTPTEIDAAVERARAVDIVVIGTISAHLHDGQAELVRTVVAAGQPTITIAMRTPWDASAYPSAGTHVCSYSLVEPSCRAVADALFGRLPFPGRLPVAEEVGV